MPYVRKFDHEEAARLYATGDFTYAALAERYGVTNQAISQALSRRDPEWRERRNRYYRDWQREHNRAPCKGGCGALVCRNVKSRSGLCPACMGLSKATSVREAELRCGNCGEWKPDEAFPCKRDAKARRGRHSICRGCQAAVRQAYRKRHAEPCVRCGRPRLSDRETAATTRYRGSRATGLCLSCYRDSVRKEVAA